MRAITADCAARPDPNGWRRARERATERRQAHTLGASRPMHRYGPGGLLVGVLDGKAAIATAAPAASAA